MSFQSICNLLEFEKALKWSNLIKTPVYSPRFFYDFVSKAKVQQNRYHLKALFTLIAMVQVPALYDLPRLNYRMQYWSTSSAQYLVCVYVGVQIQCNCITSIYNYGTCIYMCIQWNHFVLYIYRSQSSESLYFCYQKVSKEP